MHSAASAQYRKDIDGLRAIAILSVIGFHAFPDWIPGGFTGVDIFFVISGFLISTIIFNDLEHGRFSFAAFYARRVRRIFPALAIVLTACFAFGWFVLLASEYKTLGKNIASGAGFISNFSLLKTGYFDDAAAAKPLLHLWSLGIEEQFYIVWPLLLWAAWKRKYDLLKITLLITAVSFAWNILYVATRPGSMATFYLPQVRFWELSIGALLAHRALTRNPAFLPQGDNTHNLRALAGICLIVASLFVISKERLFPGFWALLPTLGAALLISGGSQSWVNRVILSNRLLVGIGLISYPLYLWHWPLLFFAYVVHGDTTTAMRVACICAAFLLSWLTYRWVEIPLRFGGNARTKAIALVSAMTLIGCGGYAVYMLDGLSSRDFAQRTQSLESAISDWHYPGDLVQVSIDGITLKKRMGIYANTQQPPRIVFLGDSHAEQIGPRVSKIAREKNVPILFWTVANCPAIPDVFTDLDPNCPSLLDNFHKILHAHPSVNTIVIGGFWNGYFLSYKQFYTLKDNRRYPLRTEEGKQLALASLQHFLQSLGKKYKVYLLLDNPNIHDLRPQYIQNRLAYDGRADNALRSVPMDRKQIDLNNALRAIAVASGATAIDQLPHLCPGGTCLRTDETGNPIYKDHDHLTAGFIANKADYIDAVFSAYK